MRKETISVSTNDNTVYVYAFIKSDAEIITLQLNNLGNGDFSREIELSETIDYKIECVVFEDIEGKTRSPYFLSQEKELKRLSDPHAALCPCEKCLSKS